MNNKPIASWTAAEIQKHCAEQKKCITCCFYQANKCILREKPPVWWDLSGKRRFTDKDIHCAHAVKALFGDEFDEVTKTGGGTCLLNSKTKAFLEIESRGASIFPSVELDEIVSLQDILDSEKDILEADND